MNTRIKQIREKLGLSQDALGKALGIGRSAISRIESGTNALTEANIKLLCQEFGVNRSWLETGTGEMLIAAPSDELVALAEKYHLRHKEFVLIEKLVTMSEKERDGIFRFMMDVVGGATGEGANPDAYVTAGGAAPSVGLSREQIHQMLDEHLDEEKEREEKSPASTSA